MSSKTYTVGQVAGRCGVAVKTVQYYADEGLLLPHGGTTEAGYRLFTDEDVADLRLIRSLRALGFSLDAIGKMMRGAADPHETARMQLDIIDVQLRGLARQRTIVANALSVDDDTDVRRRLQLGVAAASLGAAEREAAVERFLDRTRQGQPLEPESRLRRMLVMDLPDELTDAQLESWLALSKLLDDDDFIDMLHAQHEPFKGHGADAAGAAIGASIQPIIAQAVEALGEGCDAQSERVRSLALRWTQAFADALGRDNDMEFRRWFAGYAQRTNDPRIERFWRLVAALKGGTGGVSPFTAAQQLLIDGLKNELA